MEPEGVTPIMHRWDLPLTVVISCSTDEKASTTVGLKYMVNANPLATCVMKEVKT